MLLKISVKKKSPRFFSTSKFMYFQDSLNLESFAVSLKRQRESYLFLSRISIISKLFYLKDAI